MPVMNRYAGRRRWDESWSADEEVQITTFLKISYLDIKIKIITHEEKTIISKCDNRPKIHTAGGGCEKHRPDAKIM